MSEKHKEFKPSSWVIDNKIAAFVMTLILFVAGIQGYQSLPKESFPDISLPNIYVSVVCFLFSTIRLIDPLYVEEKKWKKEPCLSD